MLFAGTTVVISVLGLLLMKTSIMRGVAIGISIGVLTTMLASVTLLPALLGFVGRNIDKFGLPHRKRPEGEIRESGWTRWSHVIQRHPWPAADPRPACSSSCWRSRCCRCGSGFTDAGNRPESDTTRQAYDLVADGFGAGLQRPAAARRRDADGQADLDALQRAQRQAQRHEGRRVRHAAAGQRRGRRSRCMQVFPTTDPQAKATADLVNRLRDDVIPSVVGDRGRREGRWPHRRGRRLRGYTAERLPIFMGAVLILSFLLLMLVFRSLLVPLKAVIMNLLSIGAAYGVVVAVFQWGWGASLIGVGREAPVEAWAPVFIFAIVFGLSMDYEVFLLSRIREEYDRTGDNATAVADGLALTARVITAAALIMFFVFGSFVLGPEVALKLMGLGLAIAVLIDATVVRMVLVPATMELLGDWNWWLPKWLDRILPRVHVEGGSLEDELAELERSEPTPVG